MFGVCSPWMFFFALLFTRELLSAERVCICIAACAGERLKRFSSWTTEDKQDFPKRQGEA